MKQTLSRSFSLMAVFSLTMVHGGCQKSNPSRESEGSDQISLDLDDVLAHQGRERIFYTDSSSNLSFVYDLQERKVVLTVPFEGLARVYTGALGQYGYLVEAEYDRITIVDSGLRFVQESGTWVEQNIKPFVSEAKISGLAPTHFVAHDSRVAIFFDNEGKARILDEQSLVSPSILFNEIQTTTPHHGVAVPFGSYVLATWAQTPPTGGRPIASGVSVFTDRGIDTGLRFEGCPSLHGEVQVNTSILFGCRDGLLIITLDDSGWGVRKVSNPSGSPEGSRVGTLTAGRTPTEVIGNFGRQQLVLFDIKEESWKTIGLPAAYAQFQYDEASKLILVLGRDGFFYGIDPLTSSVQVKFDLGFAADGANHGAGDPQMVIGQQAIYLTLPHRGEIAMLERSTLTERERIQVGGEPTKIALLTSHRSRLGAKVWTQ